MGAAVVLGVWGSLHQGQPLVRAADLDGYHGPRCNLLLHCCSRCNTHISHSAMLLTWLLMNVGVPWFTTHLFHYIFTLHFTHLGMLSTSATVAHTDSVEAGRAKVDPL